MKIQSRFKKKTSASQLPRATNTKLNFSLAQNPNNGKSVLLTPGLVRNEKYLLTNTKLSSPPTSPVAEQNNNKQSAFTPPPIPTPAAVSETENSLTVNWVQPTNVSSINAEEPVDERKALAIEYEDPSNKDVQAVKAIFELEPYKKIESVFPKITVGSGTDFANLPLATNGRDPKTGELYAEFNPSRMVDTAGKLGWPLTQMVHVIGLNEILDVMITKQFNGVLDVTYALQSLSAGIAEPYGQLAVTGDISSALRLHISRLASLIEAYEDIDSRFTPRIYTPSEVEKSEQAHKEGVQLFNGNPDYVVADSLGVHFVNPNGPTTGTQGPDAITLSGEQLRANGGAKGYKGQDYFTLHNNKNMDLRNEIVDGSKGPDEFLVFAEEGAQLVINGGQGVVKNKATVFIAPGASLDARNVQIIKYAGLTGGNGQLTVGFDAEIEVISGTKTVNDLFASGNLRRS